MAVGLAGRISQIAQSRESGRDGCSRSSGSPKTQALDPPRHSPLLHHVPAIERISPPLPGCAEKIRRYARDYFRLAIRIQPGKVPDESTRRRCRSSRRWRDHRQCGSTLSAVPAQGAPLLVEGKLHGFAHGEILGKFAADLLDRRRLPVRQLCRPLVPVRQLVPERNSSNSTKSLSHDWFSRQNCSKRERALPVARLGKIARGLSKHKRHLAMEYGVIVHRSDAFWKVRNLRPIDPAVIDEPLQADEQWISCKRRRRGVWESCHSPAAQAATLATTLAEPSLENLQTHTLQARNPIPPRAGSEVGCSRMPVVRGNGMRLHHIRLMLR